MQTRRVELRLINQRRNIMRFHQIGRKRRKDRGNIRSAGAESRIQSLLQRVANHRHSVVNATQQVVRCRSDNCESVQHLPFYIPPEIPKTGKRERLFFFQVKPNRSSPISLPTAFIKAIRENQTALALHQPAKARLLAYRLGARIDHTVADRGIRRP